MVIPVQRTNTLLLMETLIPPLNAGFGNRFFRYRFFLNEKLKVIPCCPEITTTPLLVGNIFFKIDERSMILLWKGVKCFCSDVPKQFRTLLADFGHPLPIFNFFVISKKNFFGHFGGILLVTFRIVQTILIVI